jgi:hypothetical protein
MEQRKHEALGYFAVLKNLSTSEARQTTQARQRGNLCFRVFDVAAKQRISEKNPAFSLDIDHNGLVPPI